AKKAIEVVDDSFGQVVEAVRKAGGEALILADHGNAEKMMDYETKDHFTAHTTNPVPLIYVTDRKVSLAPGGILADIAPTVLDILLIPKSAEMTGESLIRTE
ncbi:MAG: 2,3-bisphosphoglycerate-independent phosphoglycerate mutase, partial [Actinomycetota bacterium]|nr:2,3-bisphosphoglycerate-independent phosphoglycerate mutase [Actinomycetota bacterium]